jgi:hypothetical protein
MSKCNAQNENYNTSLSSLKRKNIAYLNQIDTFPSFNRDTVKDQVSPPNWEIWSVQEPFKYTDTDSECSECEYRGKIRDVKGNLYLG